MLLIEFPLRRLISDILQARVHSTWSSLVRVPIKVSPSGLSPVVRSRNVLLHILLHVRVGIYR